MEIYGAGAIGAFLLNEGKDETLSYITNGAWDIYDVSKWAGKVFKEGFKRLSAKSVNKTFTDAGKKAPYDEAFDVVEGVLKDGESLVRVHGETNKARSWMMKASEIEGLSAEGIKDKFALPNLPTHISDVNVPTGTKIRVGVAVKVKGWGDGGGQQVELLEKISADSFTNTRKID